MFSSIHHTINREDKSTRFQVLITRVVVQTPIWRCPHTDNWHARKGVRVDPSPNSSMVIISDPVTISRSDAESDSGRGVLGRPGNDNSRRQRTSRKMRSSSPVRGMNRNRSGAHTGSRIREEASARRSRSEARTKATSMATGRGRSRRRSYGDTRTTGQTPPNKLLQQGRLRTLFLW